MPIPKWLSDLYNKRVHFLNYGDFHCPKVKGHVGAMFYFLHHSLPESGTGKLIEYCPMCGEKLGKKITKVSDFVEIIE